MDRKNLRWLTSHRDRPPKEEPPFRNGPTMAKIADGPLPAPPSGGIHAEKWLPGETEQTRRRASGCGKKSQVGEVRQKPSWTEKMSGQRGGDAEKGRSGRRWDKALFQVQPRPSMSGSVPPVIELPAPGCPHPATTSVVTPVFPQRRLHILPREVWAGPPDPPDQLAFPDVRYPKHKPKAQPEKSGSNISTGPFPSVKARKQEETSSPN